MANTKHSYADFLKAQSWDVYATLTTEYKLSKAAGRNAMDRFGRYLSKHFTSHRFFWVCEEFDMRKGQHIHLLFQGVSDSLSTTNKIHLMRAAWHCSIGNRATISHFRKFRINDGAEEYVTKKLCDNKCEYDFYGDWQ